MRKITKNLLRVLGVITVLVFTAVGVSAYNYHHYKRRGPDPRDSSVVAARGGVTQCLAPICVVSTTRPMVLRTRERLWCSRDPMGAIMMN